MVNPIRKQRKTILGNVRSFRIEHMAVALKIGTLSLLAYKEIPNQGFSCKHAQYSSDKIIYIPIIPVEPRNFAALHI